MYFIYQEGAANGQDAARHDTVPATNAAATYCKHEAKRVGTQLPQSSDPIRPLTGAHVWRPAAELAPYSLPISQGQTPELAPY